MADVRKTVVNSEGGNEVTEQGWDDTNSEVASLFGSKPELEQVSLIFRGGHDIQTKIYQRL